MHILKSKNDILAKAQNDFQRMKDDPSDVYAAFDFFVTARHIPEWAYPGDKEAVKEVFAKHTTMKICRHLADGSKHFILHNKGLSQVSSVENRAGSWGKSWGDTWASAWGKKGLFVELSEEFSEFGGSRVSAIELAERTLDILIGLANEPDASKKL